MQIEKESMESRVLQLEANECALVQAGLTKKAVIVVEIRGYKRRKLQCL